MIALQNAGQASANIVHSRGIIGQAQPSPSLQSIFTERQALVEMIEEYALKIGAERETNAQEFAEALMLAGFRRSK